MCAGCIGHIDIIKSLEYLVDIGFSGNRRDDFEPDAVFQLPDIVMFQGVRNSQGKGVAQLGDRCDALFLGVNRTDIARQGDIKIIGIDLHIGKVVLTGNSLCQFIFVNISKLEKGLVEGNIALLADFPGMRNLLRINQTTLQQNIGELAAFVLLIQHKAEVTFLDKSQLTEKLADCLFRKDLLQFECFTKLFRGDQLLFN